MRPHPSYPVFVVLLVSVSVTFLLVGCGNVGRRRSGPVGPRYEPPPTYEPGPVGAPTANSPWYEGTWVAQEGGARRQTQYELTVTPDARVEFVARGPRGQEQRQGGYVESYEHLHLDDGTHLRLVRHEGHMDATDLSTQRTLTFTRPYGHAGPAGPVIVNPGPQAPGGHGGRRPPAGFAHPEAAWFLGSWVTRFDEGGEPIAAELRFRRDGGITLEALYERTGERRFREGFCVDGNVIEFDDGEVIQVRRTRSGLRTTDPRSGRGLNYTRAGRHGGPRGGGALQGQVVGVGLWRALIPSGNERLDASLRIRRNGEAVLHTQSRTTGEQLEYHGVMESNVIHFTNGAEMHVVQKPSHLETWDDKSGLIKWKTN